MKKTLKLSLVCALFLMAFSSCQKDYLCKCRVEYVVNDQVVGTTTKENTIRTHSEDDAASQCVYYETDKPYLQQKTVEKNYCKLD